MPAFYNVSSGPADIRELPEFILNKAIATHVIFPVFSATEQLPKDVYPRDLEPTSLGWAESRENTTVLTFPGLEQSRYFAAYAEILDLVQADKSPHRIEVPALVVFLKGNAGVRILGLPLKADKESSSQVFLDYLRVLEKSKMTGSALDKQLQQVSLKASVPAADGSGEAMGLLQKAIQILLDMLR